MAENTWVFLGFISPRNQWSYKLSPYLRTVFFGSPRGEITPVKPIYRGYNPTYNSFLGSPLYNLYTNLPFSAPHVSESSRWYSLKWQEQTHQHWVIQQAQHLDIRW